MKTVIVGAGTIGFEIARQLISEGRDVVVLEKEAERAAFVSAHLDCLCINDEGNSPESLRKAGIEEAENLICVTDSDEVNLIMCAIAASEFNVPRKIARVRNLNYARARWAGSPFLGADYVVNPEIEAARQIINTIVHGAVSDVIQFDGTSIEVWNTLVDRASPFRNKKLIHIKKLFREEFLIAGILRGDELMIPTGKSVITENDRIYIAAAEDTLEKIFNQSGKTKQRLKKILIAGGGRIGAQVAKYLKRRSFDVTIAELDYARCRALSEEFPEVIVLRGDISDESFFEEEQLQNHDVIITATGNEELNMLAALYAKSQGISRAIALVSRPNYMAIASRLDINSTVSTKTSSVDAILKFIRKGTIRSIYSIFGGTAEVIEYSVDPQAPAVGKMLKHLDIPQDALLVAATRKGLDIIPDGNYTVQDGDTVIMFAKKPSIPKIEILFSAPQ